MSPLSRDVFGSRIITRLQPPDRLRLRHQFVVSAEDLRVFSARALLLLVYHSKVIEKTYFFLVCNLNLCARACVCLCLCVYVCVVCVKINVWFNGKSILCTCKTKNSGFNFFARFDSQEIIALANALSSGPQYFNAQIDITLVQGINFIAVEVFDNVTHAYFDMKVDGLVTFVAPSLASSVTASATSTKRSVTLYLPTT